MEIIWCVMMWIEGWFVLLYFCVMVTIWAVDWAAGMVFIRAVERLIFLIALIARLIILIAC